eukprot:15364542-Ditylum_brightwellii.AAC.3
MSINTGFNLYKTYYSKFWQYINDQVMLVHCLKVKRAPTLGFAKEIDFKSKLHEEFDVENDDAKLDTNEAEGSGICQMC